MRGKNPNTSYPIIWFLDEKLYMLSGWYNWFASETATRFWDESKGLSVNTSNKWWQHGVYNQNREFFLKHYMTDLVTPSDIGYDEMWAKVKGDVSDDEGKVSR